MSTNQTTRRTSWRASLAASRRRLPIRMAMATVLATGVALSVPVQVSRTVADDQFLADTYETKTALIQPGLPSLAPDQVLILPLPDSTQKRIRRLTRRPMSFEQNHGQFDAAAKFLARGPGYDFFLTQIEAVMMLNAPRASEDAGLGLRTCSEALLRPGQISKPPEDLEDLEDWRTPRPVGDAAVLRNSDSQARVLRMKLVGANPDASISGEEMLRAKVNYFIGNDPPLWHTNIATFAKVRYREVYPGIDLVYYGHEGRLEYDFVVTPGADPNRIALEFDGADEATVDGHGDLLLRVAGREVRWRRPVVYQEVNGARCEIPGTYQLNTELRFPDGNLESDFDEPTNRTHILNFVSFQMAAFNPALPLVIDPRLIYSTYLGGSGAEQVLGAIAVDSQGNVYVSGDTASADFPTKAALNPAFVGGAKDAFVSKFSPTGELLFSTYLGGSLDDGGISNYQRVCVAVNSAGVCYVVGSTQSSDFPLVNPLQAVPGGKTDGFVTALKADGSAILFSTYLGGQANDEPLGISIDTADNVYVVGTTASANFPTRNALRPMIKRKTGGLQYKDGFLSKLEAGGRSILYSTYYGGRRGGNDYPSDVVADTEGNAYVAVLSYPDPATTSYERWLLGKISPDGSKVLFETFFGGSGIISIPSLALGPNRRVVLAGSTEDPNLPAINQLHDEMLGDAIVAQFDGGNGSFISAIYLGSGGGNDVVVDQSGDIIVTGPTWSADFPLVDSLLPTGTAFLTRLRSSDLTITFSTLLGEIPATGLMAALDSQGNIFIAGTASSTSKFPLVNSFQSDPGGEDDAYLMKLSLGERLQVTRSDQRLALSWPAAAVGFFLETADTVAAAAWTTVPTAPSIDGDQNVVTVEIGRSPKFFRLKK